jgi:putative peptidoglycan lipid II flippase
MPQPTAPPPAGAVADGGRRTLVRANLAVAAGTLLSRLTGLVRFALLLKLLSGALADSYNVANNIPNVVYELVLGGVLTATLIPIFTEQAEQDDVEGTSAVVSIAMIATLALTILATVAAPLLIRGYLLRTPPAGVDAGQLRSVTTLFALWFLPQILFYGITFLATALLNARGRFFAAAWAPVVNNLIVSATLVVLPHVVAAPRTLSGAAASSALRLWLAVPTTAGIVAMAATVLVPLRRAGIAVHFRPNRKHPAVVRVLKLSRWTLGYVAANQVALWAMTTLAVPGSGGASAYLVAFLLFQMPMGLLAISVTTTFGPELARARIAKDRARFNDRISLGLRVLALVLLPAGALIIALARPLVSVVLERGYYKSAPAALTSGTLAAFSVGLFAVAAYLFVLRGFYAHDDTRAAFVLNVFENAVNVVVGLVLVQRFGVPGLAWSFTVAYVLAAALAVRVLTWKVPGLALRELLAGIARLAVAGAVTAEVAWLASRTVGSDTGVGAWLRLVVGATAGLATYAASITWLAAPEVTAVRAIIDRRRA